MDIIAKIHVPDYVFNFYQNAAKNIANQSTEQIMSYALSAYAAIISDNVMKDHEAFHANDKNSMHSASP